MDPIELLTSDLQRINAIIRYLEEQTNIYRKLRTEVINEKYILEARAGAWINDPKFH